MNETECPRCKSTKIVGYNIVFFSGSPSEYYQDYSCFECLKFWRNFYKTVLDSQRLLLSQEAVRDHDCYEDED